MSDLPSETTGLGKLAAGPGHIGLRRQPVRPPGPGEVTIEVLAAGICGTDLHIADDEFPSNPPVTMGHEATGEVVAVGDGVGDHWLGRRVACETYVSYCERCGHCRTGSPNLCTERRSFGSHVDGAFARWLTLPVRNLHELPAGVGPSAGALAEPLACVANCLFDPPVIAAGDRVLVAGPGTMGVLTAQAARAAGGDVTLAGLERDRLRLDVAAGLGVRTAVLAAGGDDLPDGYDVVCECSGAAAGARFALRRVRKGGRYVQIGIFGGPIEIDLDLVLYNEVTVTSGFASTPQSWVRAMALLRRGLVQLDPLVTEVVPLHEWERAFAATRAAAGLKYVLDPREEVSV